MRSVLTVGLLVLAIFAPALYGQCDETMRLTYEPSQQAICNPERGFFRFRDLASVEDYHRVRESGQTLIHLQSVAEQFHDRPLGNEFLTQLQRSFDEARRAGLKVKFRLAYNHGLNQPDAPQAVILGHIRQLQPLWEKNRDVLYVVDAGFIGAWGEWHSSTYGLDNPSSRREILLAILAALPADRMVCVRTPHFKREIFAGGPAAPYPTLSEQNRFDGSPLARVGHLNDGFLSSSDDFGTYINPNGEWPIEREHTYIGNESRFLPMGGEICALHPRNRGEQAIREMEQLHIDHLNLDFHTDVIHRWHEEGHFNTIDNRLGYRFVIQTAELPARRPPGGLLPLRFTVQNVGFGELFNPRPLEVTLQHAQTGTLHCAPLHVDPRHWIGGTTHDVHVDLALPARLPPGTYHVGLRLPDPAPSLKDDPRYAIQFANVGVWQAESGINRLTDRLEISSRAPGQIYFGPDQLQEVRDVESLILMGKSHHCGGDHGSR